MARGRPLLRQGQPKVQHRRPTLTPPNDAEHVRNWALLAAGEKVHILQENGTELIGHVDAVTDDGEILWLQLVAGAGRRLFSYSEGGLVWRLTVDCEQV
jgi:hypothetical protein